MLAELDLVVFQGQLGQVFGKLPLVPFISVQKDLLCDIKGKKLDVNSIHNIRNKGPKYCCGIFDVLNVLLSKIYELGNVLESTSKVRSVSWSLKTRYIKQECGAKEYGSDAYL